MSPTILGVDGDTYRVNHVLGAFKILHYIELM